MQIQIIRFKYGVTYHTLPENLRNLEPGSIHTAKPIYLRGFINALHFVSVKDKNGENVTLHRLYGIIEYKIIKP